MEGHELYITASIDMAMSASGEERLNDLRHNADAATHQAKEKGEETWYMVFEART